MLYSVLYMFFTYSLHFKPCFDVISIKQIPANMQPETLIPRSQQSNTGPYHEPNQSSSNLI